MDTGSVVDGQQIAAGLLDSAGPPLQVEWPNGFWVFSTITESVPCHTSVSRSWLLLLGSNRESAISPIGKQYKNYIRIATITRNQTPACFTKSEAKKRAGGGHFVRHTL